VATRVLIAGVSTRALARSAARAGYQVTAVDAFADLDLLALADVLPVRSAVGHRFSPQRVATMTKDLQAEMVAYTSNFENYPVAVSRLAQHRRLLGNPAEVLRRVRDPIALMRLLGSRRFAVPMTRATPPSGQHKARPWLLKPRRSGGGHGTSKWRVGQSVPRSHYLQERIHGVTGSVLFAANDGRAIPLGVSRQLVGDTGFGAGGFRYCGSLVGPPAQLFPGQEGVLEIATELAGAVVAEYGLTGLNGIDFIARGGVAYPIEVNPRYSASMELLERWGSLSIFELHVAACGGTLTAVPSFPPRVEGKAVVFATRAVTMGNTRRWLSRPFLADIPHPGERIARGRPICTVFASENDAAACYRLLLRRATRVYRATHSLGRRAA
jgi:uncharacterized protein